MLMVPMGFLVFDKEGLSNWGVSDSDGVIGFDGSGGDDTRWSCGCKPFIMSINRGIKEGQRLMPHVT